MRTINQLSAAQVAKTTKPGRYGDGHGLYLQISKWGSKAWIYRFQIAGKPRSMGLGSINDFSLREARELALRARQMVRTGFDPIAERAQRRSATRVEKAKVTTFATAAAAYVEAHAPGWKPGNANQWRASLAAHALPIIGDAAIGSISTADVLRCVEPIWLTKTVTANRVRNRIERIWDWGRARGLCQGENPARWIVLKNLLPSQAAVTTVQHLPSMPFAELPAFMERLREQDSVCARGLELAILTAARTSEVLLATWDEIDFNSKLWVIPAGRMKGQREHRVPLADRTLAILSAMPREAGGQYIFPGAKKGGPLSHTALRKFLTVMDGGANTVHGFRSSFRDWAGEQTSFPREVVEAALAHVVGDQTERAYRRGDALQKRAALMAQWERYCTQPPAKANNVLPMARA